KAGAGEVFAVFSLAGDPIEEPVVVVPVRAGGDAKAIGEELHRGGTFAETASLGQAVVAGSKANIDRLRGLKPVARPAVAKALAAALPPILAVIAQDRDVKKFSPNFGKVAAGLKLPVTDSRITFAVEEAELAELVRPLLAEIPNARRTASMNTLKQIGLAMH